MTIHVPKGYVEQLRSLGIRIPEVPAGEIDTEDPLGPIPPQTYPCGQRAGIHPWFCACPPEDPS